MNHKPWSSIFDKYDIYKHDFSKSPFVLTAQQIKEATAHFTTTTEREVRVLCKQDTRESRPQIFIDHNLFILPIKNGTYAIRLDRSQKCFYEKYYHQATILPVSSVENSHSKESKPTLF